MMKANLPAGWPYFNTPARRSHHLRHYTLEVAAIRTIYSDVAVLGTHSIGSMHNYNTHTIRSILGLVETLARLLSQPQLGIGPLACGPSLLQVWE